MTKEEDAATEAVRRRLLDPEPARPEDLASEALRAASAVHKGEQDAGKARTLRQGWYLLVITLVLLGAVVIIATSCGSSTGVGSGSSSKAPTNVRDVTGQNNFSFDEVQTPEGVVECVIFWPDHDPGLSCNWGKFNAQHPTTSSTTTTLFGS